MKIIKKFKKQFSPEMVMSATQAQVDRSFKEKDSSGRNGTLEGSEGE